MKNEWVGIDYGSKLAGTTVVCYLDKNELVIKQSKKKEDADQWLIQQFEKLKPQHVFIDAPLSLPSAFYKNGEDYFYRKCDRETKAMSPMFLGGLTARAMRLNSQTKEIKFIETYPGYLIRNVLELKPHYSKRKTYDPTIEHHLASKYNLVLKEPLGNWHQLDALACWVSGYRFFHNKSIKFGDESEGQIVI